MTTEAYVVHHTVDRCRLRLPHMRGDHEFFEQLRSELDSSFDGIIVTVNAVTGSVLMVGSIPSLDSLARTAGTQSWFDLDANRHAKWNVSDTSIFDIDSLDMRKILSVSFLALAAVQVLRGQVLVPASSFLMYALAVSAVSPDLHEAAGQDQ